MGGSQVYLKENEIFTIEDLLYSLIIQSANDSAVALAIHVAGSKDGFVEMMQKKARELGMNPNKLGKKNNHKQQPWKMPLRQFIEHLYFKRFGKECPDSVLSIEDRIRMEESKKARKREAKRIARQAAATGTAQP